MEEQNNGHGHNHGHDDHHHGYAHHSDSAESPPVARAAENADAELERFLNVFADNVLRQRVRDAVSAQLHARTHDQGHSHSHSHNHGHDNADDQGQEHHHHSVDALSRNTMIMETLYGFLNSITLAQTLQAISGLNAAWYDMDTWSIAVGSALGVSLSIAAAGTHLYLNRRYQPLTPEAKRYLESGREIPKVPWPIGLKILFYYLKYGDFASHTLNYASAAIQITEGFIDDEHNTLEVWKRILKGLGYLAIMGLTAALATPGEVRPCWVELEKGFDLWAYDLYVANGNRVPEDAFDTNATLTNLVTAVQGLKKIIVLESFGTALRELIRMHNDHAYENLAETDKKRFYEPIYNALVRDEYSIELLRDVPRHVLLDMRAYFLRSSEFKDDEFIDQLNLLMSSTENILERFNTAKQQLIRGFPLHPTPDDFRAIYEGLGKYNLDANLLRGIPENHLVQMRDFYLSLMSMMETDPCYIIFMKKLTKLCPIREDDRFGPARISGTHVLQRLGLFKVERALNSVVVANNNNATQDDAATARTFSASYQREGVAVAVDDGVSPHSASEQSTSALETDDEGAREQQALLGRSSSRSRSMFSRCTIQ